MTGVEFNREYQREIFKAYSTYYSNVKLNDLFKKALVVSLNDRYADLLGQDSFDDLSAIIKLNKKFLLNSNQLLLSPLDIVNVAHAAAFTVTTRTPHNVIVGDSITIANVAGFTTPINGVQQVVSVVDDFSFTFSAVFTGGTYMANTGQIVLVELNQTPKMVADYNHLLAVRARFDQTLNYVVADVSNSQPIKVSLNTINNNITSREQIAVSGVVGNTNANGSFYVKKENRKTFSLYIDKDLTSATSGNGLFQGLAALTRIFYNYCVPVISIEKISSYNKGTIQSPVFERGDNALKISPYDSICSEVTMDYISNAVVFVDVADSVINLEDTYRLDFLYQVIAMAVKIFASEVNDQSKYQTASAEIQTESK